MKLWAPLTQRVCLAAHSLLLVLHLHFTRAHTHLSCLLFALLTRQETTVISRSLQVISQQQRPKWQLLISWVASSFTFQTSTGGLKFPTHSWLAGNYIQRNHQQPRSTQTLLRKTAGGTIFGGGAGKISRCDTATALHRLRPAGVKTKTSPCSRS